MSGPLDPIDEMVEVLRETLRANDLTLLTPTTHGGREVSEKALDQLARGLLARRVAARERPGLDADHADCGGHCACYFRGQDAMKAWREPVRLDHRRTCWCGHRYRDHATGGMQCLAQVNDPDQSALIACQCHRWEPLAAQQREGAGYTVSGTAERDAIRRLAAQQREGEDERTMMLPTHAELDAQQREGAGE